MNLGVRLGTPSKIRNGYLACIDVDVKNKAYLEIALKTAKALLNGVESPIVTSGGGNGSRHYYVVTRAPFEQITVAKEKGWEVVFYSTGRQMVLPPSVHPSGRLYRWKREGLIPCVNVPKSLIAVSDESEKFEGSALEDFEVSPVELDWLNLSEKIRKGILTGEDVTDRSAFLLTAVTALHSASLTKNEILTVLTEPKSFLGKASYDHAKTNSRSRAALWLWKYTVRRVLKERDAKSVFTGVEIEDRELNAQDTEKQSLGLKADRHWKQDLELGQNKKPKSTVTNIRSVIINAVSEACYRWDQFGVVDVYGCDTPWGGKKGENSSVNDVALIRFWLQDKFELNAKTEDIKHAIIKISSDNPFHPVKDYFRGLPIWDRVRRVERLFIDYFGAEGDKRYLKEISRKTLVALVRRIFQPGIKFDYMPVLIGAQGTKKSWAIKELVGKKWFTDMPIDPRSKDTVLGLRGKWLAEVGELACFRSSDTNTLKAFLTREEDRIRVPYRDKLENFPREFIFMGSANDDQFLKDQTGNRRFWTFAVKEADFEKVIEDRDQIWAEALLLEKAELRLDLDDDLIRRIAEREQESRVFHDMWEEKIAHHLVKSAKPENGIDFPQEGFSLHDLFGPHGPFAGERSEKIPQMRVSGLLQKMGYRQFRVQKDGIQAMRYYKTGFNGLKWED